MDDNDQRAVLEERAYALILGALVRVLGDVDLAWLLADLAAGAGNPEPAD